MRKLTTQEFIERVRKVHGDRYDYSFVDYQGADKKVKIICTIHGEFLQGAASHWNGNGCPECRKNKFLGREGFLQQAKAVHGDKYDYSRVEYKNNRTKVEIICPDHGVFLKAPDKHIHSRQGCKICSHEKLGRERMKSREKFIADARKIHGDLYGYDLVDYRSTHRKVEIVCETHGPFWIEPASHLSQKAGCPKCSHERKGEARRTTQKDFIDKANRTHNGFYDYSLAEYVTSHELVKIICPIHGVFEQTPGSHLAGRGCNECGRVSTQEKQRKNPAEFISEAVAIHENKYDYSKVQYKNFLTKVVIICPEHGEFRQTPSDHLSGRGCSDCAATGFNAHDRGVLYYVAVTTNEGHTLYKIGITNYSVEERFAGADMARIRLVKQWQFVNGYDALDRETEILRLYKGEKYSGPDVLVSGGNSELFVSDILGLDESA